jgi:hypothetical protein
VHVLCVWVGILPAPSVELREIPARPNIGSDARDTPYFVGLKFVAQSSWLNLLGSIFLAQSTATKGKPAAPCGAAG